MNSLSWMLYLAELFGSLRIASHLALTILSVGGLLGVIGFAIEDKLSHLKPYKWPVFTIFGIAVFTSIITPSKETVYAIAASEMGEAALQSKTGGKAIKALDAWLDKQIDDGGAK